MTTPISPATVEPQSEVPMSVTSTSPSAAPDSFAFSSTSSTGFGQSIDVFPGTSCTSPEFDPLSGMQHSNSVSVDDGIVPIAHNLFNNMLIQSKTRVWTKVYDPATQAFLTRVPESTMLEVQQAVAAATVSQPYWAAVPFQQRRMKILELVHAVQQNRHRILSCLVTEAGKTFQDAETEFDRGVDAILGASGIGNEMNGSYWSGSPANTHTVYEPLGVCLSVTPFNFPFLIPLWTLPLAIITGNTVVLKPSEKVPSTSMVLSDCFVHAGFPPGVFNLVHGGASAVGVLLSQPAVMAVNYVGSEIGGERVYEHAKANRKRVQVECGGKNHAVVLPDAAKRSTLYAIAGSAFGAAGQRCMASSVVVFVGSSMDWLGELVDIASSLVVGCGADPSVGMGPLITAAAKERVVAMINEAEQDGAQVVLDGRSCFVEGYPNGNFVGPTILTHVEPYMQCYQEEIFGPVLVCLQVNTLSEAIEIVNDNRYGNGCTLFTSSPLMAKTFQDEVNVGQIGINVPVLAPSGVVPRTTNKESFLGDVRGPGAARWQFYTNTKTVTTLWRSDFPE